MEKPNSPLSIPNSPPNSHHEQNQKQKLKIIRMGSLMDETTSNSNLNLNFISSNPSSSSNDPEEGESFITKGPVTSEVK